MSPMNRIPYRLLPFDIKVLIFGINWYWKFSRAFGQTVSCFKHMKIFFFFYHDIVLFSRMITQLSSLMDPFDMKCEATNPSVKKELGTCDTANNSYSDSKNTKLSPEGKRIDHILFKTKDNWEVRSSPV